MDSESVTFILDVINAGGSLGVFSIFLYLFVRGDIISKKTMDEIVESLMSEVAARIILAVNDVVKDALAEHEAGIITDMTMTPLPPTKKRSLW